MSIIEKRKTYNTTRPAQKAMNRVRKAFDAERLRYVLELDDFSEYAPRVELEPYGDHERFYHYVDNGSNILAVAHLDSVEIDGTANVVDTNAGLLVTSGRLDDRLGAYVILELLPKLGVKFDWLLTTDEELGASTAEDFVTDKDYNWIIEFDRGGTDVVMYDYETPDLVELVEASGADVGLGSFTDICMLEHLEAAAFNWGVGYRDYHGPRSHAWLEDTFAMVARFMKFHTVNKETYLPHEARWPLPWTQDQADEGAIHDLLGQMDDDDLLVADLPLYQRLLLAEYLGNRGLPTDQVA